MAAEGHDDTKPVAEGKVHREDTGGSTEEAKTPADETNDRVEGAKKLVEEAKKSVENLMKSVEEGQKGEASDDAKGPGDVVEGDSEAEAESKKPGEKEVDSTRATEASASPAEDAGEPEKDEFKPADGAAPTARRPATPIPFSRTSDGTRTPVSQGRITPEDLQETPRGPRTPPPLTTRSLGRPSNDGLKTPSDMSGRWTPSTPKTPGHASSADSIRRKPVPAPSSDNLRERSASTLKNPLEKTTVTIMPDRLGEKAPGTPDSTPRTHISLPGSKKKGFGWRRVGRLWWVEGAWCSASLLCIIIIFAVLSAYDNHPVVTLPLNLPALLAFFTTAAILFLVIPVRECISQWKWNHLRADTRSLFDFQLFDSASRSPLGAATLLVKLRQTHIALVGAVILLLSLSAPAITQVAIGYKEGTMPAGGGGESSVSATRILENKIEGLGSAVEDGVKGSVGLSLPVSCHTGQCDFEPFEALGICAEVHDVSDKLNITTGSRRSGNSTDSPVSSGSAYNVSLPEEANCHFMTGDPRNVMTCKTDGSATLSFEGDFKDSAIYSMPVIYSNPEDDSDDADVEFEALEVLFHLCLNTYSASVRHSQPGFKIDKTSATLASGSDDRAVDVECEAPIHAGSEGAVKCEAEDVPSDAFMKLSAKGRGDVEVSAQFEALGEVAMAMGEGLVGLWMQEGDDDPSIVGTPLMEDISKVVYGGEVNEQKDRVTKMAESIATSLTNAISAKKATDDTSPNVIPISGTSLHPQTLIAINYAPLSLLLILALGSLAFLVATAVLTERDAGMEVLKSSALATLFALEEECRGVAGGLETVESMGRKARVMHVRLRDEAIVLAGEEAEEREKAEEV